MRPLVCVWLCLLVGAAGAWPSLLQDDHEPTEVRKQQTINRLLYKVTEPLAFNDVKKMAEQFDPVADISIYDDGGMAAIKLIKEIEDGRVLQQHHWFSLFNPRQREEALMLLDVLMHCKNWHCGIHAAAYFREKMNEGEFVYALYTAVLHSPKRFAGVVLPPLYEVTPHMFTNSEVIQKAYSAQMTQSPGTFKMDFTGSQRNPEQHVAYFGEDIGMNLHHVMWHMDFPFWWDDSYGYHLDRKGELFFWAHHQLTARFDAERLSNHLDMVDELYWDQPIKDGFAPHTTYRYGGEFPTRPDNINFADIDGIIRVRDMIIHESRIRDAIAHGYITKKDGTHIDIMNAQGIDTLGDLIESSVYSANAPYYGALHNEAHILLGRQSDPHGKFNLPPSVMEHFETATRDPAFFRLHKYMDGIFKEHKDLLPPYTSEDLYLPDVSVHRVRIKGQLETYFEDFEFDLKMGVDSSESVEEVDVKATVPRLNHNKFAYEISIKCEGSRPSVVVRVYLCPLRDNNGIIFTLEESRWHCIEMDKFWTKLSADTTWITRQSTDSSVTIPDRPSFSKLMRDADLGVDSDEESMENEELVKSCGIPNRMLLPKGSPEGMEFRLIVAVTDASADEASEFMEEEEYIHHNHGQCGVQGQKYPDSKPMGFPLDRKIVDDRVFTHAKNIDTTTIVKVYHKEQF